MPTRDAAPYRESLVVPKPYRDRPVGPVLLSEGCGLGLVESAPGLREPMALAAVEAAAGWWRSITD